METKEIYASLSLMPEFPRYQAYLEGVASRMPGALSHRCAALVHQIVLSHRVMALTSQFCPDMPDAAVEFMSECWTASNIVSIEYACLQRRQDEIINCAMEAYKIFREEEAEVRARRIMLDQFDTSYKLAN